jgi:hypothetical protein
MILFKFRALLKLRVVIGLPAALFSSLAAEKALSSPSLSSGRIFPLSFSAGVLKNRLGTGLYLGIFLIQPAGFLYWEIKTKRKRARGRRRLEDPAGRKPTRKSPPRQACRVEAKFSYILTTALTELNFKINIKDFISSSRAGGVFVDAKRSKEGGLTLQKIFSINKSLQKRSKR